MRLLKLAQSVWFTNTKFHNIIPNTHERACGTSNYLTLNNSGPKYETHSRFMANFLKNYAHKYIVCKSFSISKTAPSKLRISNIIVIYLKTKNSAIK